MSTRQSLRQKQQHHHHYHEPRPRRGVHRRRPSVRSSAVEPLEGRRLLAGQLIGISGNQGPNPPPPTPNETLYEINIGVSGTTEAQFLDGFEALGTATHPTTLQAVTAPAGAPTAVTQGSGALRVDAANGQGVFWGARSGNVASILGNTGNMAQALAYDLTLTNIELNGGAYGGGTDDSFNGFAQNNELAVVIATMTGEFIQRNFAAAGNFDTLGTNATWSGVDGTRTIEWDLTRFMSSDGKTIAQFITDNAATEARFWFVTQGGDSNGSVGPMRFYFDNMRVRRQDGTEVRIADFDLLSLDPLDIDLPFVPDTDAIGFNPDTGLLHRTSGAESYSNSPTNNGFRDNQFMETIDLDTGTQTAVFNANSEQFGLPAPRPAWVLPTTRRTDEQTGGEFRVRGPNEYHAARDLVWSDTENVFFVADEQGLFRLTAAGQSTFVGRPAGGVGDPAEGEDDLKGLAFFTIDGQRRLLASERADSDEGFLLWTINPQTGQKVGEAVIMTGPTGQPAGVLSLVEDSDNNRLLGIAQGGGGPFQRQLVEINPVTGAVSILGDLGIHMADLAFVPEALGVAGRHIFYNRSVWDGSTGQVPDGPNDDAAIAPDKVALLPGQAASFANVISFTKGITGIMVDIAGLPDGPGIAAVTADDFVFRVGAGNDPSAYTPAPAPSAIEVRPGQGVSGTDRIEIAWANNAILKQWLQVTVLANADTGLSAPDVFYYGNLPGEVGDNPNQLFVNAIDVQRTRNAQFQQATITSAFDHNRDGGIVNALDLQQARINQFSTIALFTAPAALRIDGQDDEDRE